MTTKYDLSGFILTSATLSLLLWAAVPGAAQWIDIKTPGIPRTADGKPNLTAPTPKAADGKPDLSGLWNHQRGENPPARGTDNTESVLHYMPAGTELPMRPATAALFKKYTDAEGAERPSGRCLPHTIPDAFVHGGPKRILQTPGVTAILFEQMTNFRQIFTDGRPQPPVTIPAWFGYSTGKWEGNTFVVETTGFNDQSWLDDAGHPHSDALHTTERFTRPDFGHLEVKITIDDEKAYTRPWTETIHFVYAADMEMIEDVCDNEKDAEHVTITR